MILFTHRYNAEIEYEGYCEDTGTLNCTMNFIAWLQTSNSGKKLVIGLYADLIESMATTLVKE